MTKSKDERYIVRQIVGYLTQLPDHDRELRSQVLEHRRWTERRLLSSQEIVDVVNIVEKRWFMKWLDFIIGKSSKCIIRKKSKDSVHLDNKFRY